MTSFLGMRKSNSAPFGCLGLSPLKATLEGKPAPWTMLGEFPRQFSPEGKQPSQGKNCTKNLEPEFEDAETECGASVCGGGSLNGTPWPSPEVPQLSLSVPQLPEFRGSRSRANSEDEEIVLTGWHSPRSATSEDASATWPQEEEAAAALTPEKTEKPVFVNNWSAISKSLANIFKEEKKALPKEVLPEPINTENWTSVGRTLAAVFREMSEAGVVSEEEEWEDEAEEYSCSDHEEEEDEEDSEAATRLEVASPARVGRPMIPKLSLPPQRCDDESEEEELSDEETSDHPQGSGEDDGETEDDPILAQNWQAVGKGLAAIFREEADTLHGECDQG